MKRLPIALAGTAAAMIAAVPSVSAAPASVQQETQHVTYRGYDVTVPASWRVVNLDENPSACIIFDASTVYVGRAGDQQDCPAHAVGGAPSLWIQPLDAGTPTAGARTLERGAAVATQPDADGESQVVVREAGVLATSFGGAEAAKRLESATLTAGARPAAAGTGTATAASTASGTAEPLSAVEAPGTFKGRGFDACAAPSGATMAAWKSATNFRGVGVYIGGVSRACAQPNLTADWVKTRTAGGWHVLPIYVGLQAPCTSFAHRMSSNADTARGQGRNAAGAAISAAQSKGIGADSVIYYDIEGFDNGNDTCRKAVLNFLSGWTNQLHRKNYRSGVYSSISSGVTALSNTYASDSYSRPNHIWAAWWNGKANADLKPYVPDGQWNQRQRVHQYRGGHNETHGGHTLNIDSNFLNVH